MDHGSFGWEIGGCRRGWGHRGPHPHTLSSSHTSHPAPHTPRERVPQAIPLAWGCPGCPFALLSGPVLTHRCSCLLADVGSVEGLAYHRGWDTLYWTSYTTSTITRHTVDQTRPGAFERETVITMSGDDHPRAFVLDECQK